MHLSDTDINPDLAPPLVYMCRKSSLASVPNLVWPQCSLGQDTHSQSQCRRFWEANSHLEAWNFFPLRWQMLFCPLKAPSKPAWPSVILVCPTAGVRWLKPPKYPLQLTKQYLLALHTFRLHNIFSFLFPHSAKFLGLCASCRLLQASFVFTQENMPSQNLTFLAGIPLEALRRCHLTFPILIPIADGGRFGNNSSQVSSKQLARLCSIYGGLIPFPVHGRNAAAGNPWWLACGSLEFFTVPGPKISEHQVSFWCTHRFYQHCLARS